ncbi:MAG TPA: EfeM/EfeO family lipoprotein [Solirubrobacteraceae bacterium]|jgi:iron uptake system EfeUOB component EfeO/EfeM|nr:EfeM/EfeO family lipoprotein [Solirubrobacteraceae bacterium]
MPTSTVDRHRPGRRLLPVCAGLLSAVAGFFALTALGAGGAAGTARAPAAAPARALTPLQAYSQQAATREGLGNIAGARPVQELVPVAPAEFDRPIAESRAYAQARLRAMAKDVDRLIGALAAGSRSRSEQLWLTAYGTYLRLGGVYGEFGQLDTAIDGTPGGLARGTANPDFTGLHRIEFGLWTGRAPDGLLPAAVALAGNIRRLEKVVPTVAITPLAYATRAHEILEDAQRDFLSGADVPWSGEGVFATAAAVAATEEVLTTLRPLLDGRGSTIEQVDFGLTRLRAVLAEIRHAHGGGWPTLGQLSQLASERLDGALGFVLEELAGIPGELETQMPPTIPALPAPAGR